MPTYIYICDGCGQQAEVHHSIADAGNYVTYCKCGQKMRRAYTPPHIIVRGGTRG